MSIGEQINTRLKEAMRARDQQTLDLLRMVKSRMTERTTAKGFTGEVNDALWIEVIESYAKSQHKALEQFRAGGAAAAEHVAGIEWELDALKAFLPSKADEATVRGWVDEAFQAAGDAPRAGAIMGAVMKAHKGEADAALVRRLVDERLAAQA